MVKLTFTLDEATVDRLRKLANRSKKPQSLVVREAVAYYAEREDMLSDDERGRMLTVLDEMRLDPITRDQVAVDKELRDIRTSRKSGWRRPSEK
jgi:predicted transcriptional regulator